MNFEKQYKEICLKIWGCIPTDVNWAKNTNLYKEELNRLTKEVETQTDSVGEQHLKSGIED